VGENLRIFRGECASVSDCVHGECQLIGGVTWRYLALDLRLHSHKLQSNTVGCDMTRSDTVFIMCAVLHLCAQPLQGDC
jgi:hypothetical protein